METINNQVGEESRPLALHIRRLRQWYGDKPLGQSELAKLAGVSDRQLQRYESCRKLPPGLSALLSIAIALKKPLESIIAPDLFDEILADVEARRVGSEDKPDPVKPWCPEDEY